MTLDEKIKFYMERDCQVNHDKSLLEAIREYLIRNGCKVEDDDYNPNQKGISVRKK